MESSARMKQIPRRRPRRGGRRRKPWLPLPLEEEQASRVVEADSVESELHTDGQLPSASSKLAHSLRCKGLILSEARCAAWYARRDHERRRRPPSGGSPVACGSADFEEAPGREEFEADPVRPRWTAALPRPGEKAIGALTRLVVVVRASARCKPTKRVFPARGSNFSGLWLSGRDRGFSPRCLRPPHAAHGPAAACLTVHDAPGCTRHRLHYLSTSLTGIPVVTVTTHLDLNLMKVLKGWSGASQVRMERQPWRVL